MSKYNQSQIPELHEFNGHKIQTHFTKLQQLISKVNDHRYFKFSASYHNTQCKSHAGFISKCIWLKSRDLLEIVSYGYNHKKKIKSAYESGVSVLGRKFCELVPFINASVDQNVSSSNGSHTDVDVLHHEENIEDMKDTGHFFNDLLYYIDSDGTRVDISLYEMWRTRQNNFLGMSCSVSKWKVYIDWDGGVYRCFNEQFSPIKPIFNVNSIGNNYSEYFKTLKCIDCVFTTCFFDLEYKKTSTETHVDEVKISRYYNTSAYRDNESNN